MEDSRVSPTCRVLLSIQSSGHGVGLSLRRTLPVCRRRITQIEYHQPDVLRIALAVVHNLPRRARPGLLVCVLERLR